MQGRMPFGTCQTCPHAQTSAEEIVQHSKDAWLSDGELDIYAIPDLAKLNLRRREGRFDSCFC
jgi:hypothetical protein